jgi:hypothetical protein
MEKESRFSSNRPERGSAGAKLLIVVVLLLLMANAGYNYVPVAYEAETLKTGMETAVLQGMAVARGQKPVNLVKTKLLRVVAANNAPSNTFVQVTEVNQVVHATVKYTKRVNLLPFGIFQYDYVFDHTATPSGLLLQ